MLNLWMDILGWIGAVLIIIPYFLVSSGKVAGESKLFQIYNIVGGVLLIANSLFYGALPSVFLNLVWISIGVVTLVKQAAKKVTANDSI